MNVITTLTVLVTLIVYYRSKVRGTLFRTEWTIKWNRSYNKSAETLDYYNKCAFLAVHRNCESFGLEENNFQCLPCLEMGNLPKGLWRIYTGEYSENIYQ